MLLQHSTVLACLLNLDKGNELCLLFVFSKCQWVSSGQRGIQGQVSNQKLLAQRKSIEAEDYRDMLDMIANKLKNQQYQQYLDVNNVFIIRFNKLLPTFL